MFAKAQRVHFIGIGGIGMSGIAEILLNLGYAVSGSDLRRTAITERLAALGATIFEGHAAANVLGSGVVVTSSAVSPANPEVAEARSRKIPVIPRAEMLAEMMRLKYGIAVAGMHGKTTTTSMIATVLAAGDLDPTVVVGGRVDAMGSNARLGRSQYLVAEADESDRSFLKLSPILAVVTNIDREHMDCYRDMGDVEDAFVEFMDKVPFYGCCVACLDSEALAAVLPRVRRRIFTYGMEPKADYVARLLPATGGARSRFEVAANGQVLGPFELHVPGRHNVLNATAAVAIAMQLELSPERIAQGLAGFRGVDRRFQIKGVVRGVTVIDDYGHHPTEIRATLAAARECGFKRIRVIFQPHRYSRTRDLMEEFASCFSEADAVEVLDIYAASEEPLPGITAEALVKTIGRDGVRYAASIEEAVERSVMAAGEGDAILTMGAGNVSQASGLVLAALKRDEAKG
ncbi:UDP-N-acetylmuramate--L-alanine ligase [Acidipila rosea]|uniref:UDP-N-acetylmuramate--L-alanine ligase n=1 Tax=Acidipila rosea TaxID=768535 RepID=A0A4R1L7H2_9BACT|nr:UDP-N-acetylmuramate--L-alanine ligase [Acidipila rosea]TCK74192.1 UDP-N-acetylmuramate--L-alanine ligase [Acidipila rosea]